MTQSKSANSRQTKIDGVGTSSPDAANDLSQAGYALPFFHYLTIPKNTPIATPTTFTLQLPIGMIYRTWIEFPKGCSGLAGVQVWRAVRQVFPLPENTWLRSDNSVLNFAFTHPINTEPYEIILKGYNLDDTYEHTVWVGFEMKGLQKDLSPNLLGLIEFLKG